MKINGGDVIYKLSGLIKEYCDAQGLTVQQFAKKAGISRQMTATLIAGYLITLSLDKFFQVLNAMDIQADDFFRELIEEYAD